MTPRERHARLWTSAAALGAQISATATGMLPLWVLPITVAVTILVSRQTGSVDPGRSKLMRALGTAGVALFASLIALKTLNGSFAVADPRVALRSLTGALVVLSLVIAPTARSPREHRVWLTVTTGVLVAAAAGDRTLTGGLITFACWSILLVAIALTEAASPYAGEAIVATTIGSVDPRANRRWPARAAIAPLGAALMAGSLVYIALPSGLGGGGLARQLIHHVGSTSGGPAATRDSIGVDTSGTGDLSLLVRGSLSDTPILRVPLGSPVLWRGTIYSTYTGSSWQATINQPGQFARPGVSTVPITTQDPVPVGTTHTYTERYVGPGFGSLIWAPGVALKIRGVDQPVRGFVHGPSNIRVFGEGVDPAYSVTTAVATTERHQLTTTTGPDVTDPEWTQLPTELPIQVSTLAHQITANASNRYQKVTELESYLRHHETYSLTSPVPGAGQDAVYDFLFRDHVGFCEQFASAEAVMLRALGIPARVVTGLAYGTPSGSTRLYTEANSHAWVEVYYPGIGWSPTDPTAGASLAPAAATNESILRRMFDAVSSIPGGTTALVSIAVLVVLGLGLLNRSARFGSRGGGRRLTEPSSPTGPVLTAFNQLAADPRSATHRAQPETAREYLDRVGQSSDLSPTIGTLEQEVYGATAPTDQDVEAAVAALHELGRTPA